MDGESRTEDEPIDATPQASSLDGTDTVRGELSKELAVLHRVFRHNFRNQLNTILGHAEIAMAKTGDQEVSDCLEVVLEQAHDLEDTVAQVSTIQHLASSGAVPEVVNISQSLENIVEKFDEHTSAAFEMHVPESVWIWANPAIERAFTELVENAVVHNDSSTPRVTVGVTRAQTVDVSIADNGPGMPSGTASTLESEQVDDINHLTGLGLWIAYWAITRSGGKMTIDSTDGCRISVSLRPAPAPEN